MEMTNNFTNYLNSSNVSDIHTLVNGVSPIKRIAEGIRALQENQYWSNESKAKDEATNIWRASADFKTLMEFRTEQRKLREDTSKTFWGKRKNQARITEVQGLVREIYERNIPYSWSSYSSAIDAAETIDSHVRYDAANLVSDVRLPESTIYAVLLTIPELETKSFDDILKTINKYVSK